MYIRTYVYKRSITQFDYTIKLIYLTLIVKRVAVVI